MAFNNSSFNAILQKDLKKRAFEGSLRRLNIIENLIDFCSNDYLGFAQSVDIENTKGIFLLNQLYTGSTGSRLISGNYQNIEDLEKYIAAFHNARSGLIYNSGYDANIGLFSCIAKKGDTILYDELIHASVRDGIRLSFASAYSFRHNNLQDLEKKLTHCKGNVFIAVESVYSMDGDFSPLTDLVNFCKKHNCYLIVDEAHSTGIYGKEGRGRVNELKLESEETIIARVHTFGKALGSHGAIILGSDDLRSYLINFSRSFIYTTALPPYSIRSIKSSYEKLVYAKDKIKKLHHLILFFKSNIKTKNTITLLASDSPIQSILLPGNINARSIAGQLQDKGFDVRAILSPTVKPGTERIRICLHSYNTEEQVMQLIDSLTNLIGN